MVGQPQLFVDRGLEAPASLREAVGRARDRGDSVSLVAVGGEIVGCIAISDTIKPDAREAIQALKLQGLRTVLLTGDSRQAGERIANELGMDDVIAEVLPQEKAEVIEKLRADGQFVAMVGDGINDSIALATADLGLGVVNGTDIALRAADIIIVRDDLIAIADAVGLSRKTLKTIKTNLVWAFAYNMAAVPVAAAGLLNPLIAAAAMSLSSVLVVQNSLRLSNYRSKRVAARDDHEADELLTAA